MPCATRWLESSFLVLLALLYSSANAQESKVEAWRATGSLPAIEANQAAATDERFVYAIGNSVIAKYDRRTGERLATSTGAATHLNSGFVWQGRIYCAHSNYPQIPEQSEIMVLDVETMRLATFKDFGNFGGSLTWAVRMNDFWWCNFARYGADNAQTFIVKFDLEWRELGRWTYPDDVLRELGRYSLSGGIWRDETLVVTGHDDPILYRLQLPKSGNVLEFIDKQAIPFTGQGIAADPLTGGLIGINRAKKQIVFAESVSPKAADGQQKTNEVFRRDNLIVWCVVPFDAKRRGPEERAAMLARLGFKHFAYDYRVEHVPTFEVEIAACKRYDVALDAWWFPGTFNEEAKHILDVCKRSGIRPQLWVSGGGEPTNTPEEQRRRVEQEAARIRPIAEAAAAQQMKVGLYNHGGWFGEPENQLAVIEYLKLPNVGIVYNLHHGHDHVDRLAEILRKTLPFLLAINLNGTNRGGDRRGQKILQLGQGELDLSLLRTIRDSGYRGPIGILGHTQNDAEAQLQDNLNGLDWLLPQLEGKPPGARPIPRTPIPKATAG